MTASGPARLTDAIVIYDAIYGSLRLTEPLYDAFTTYLARLGRGASLAGDEAIVSDVVAERLRSWAETLTPAGSENFSHIEVPEGWRPVYKRGSIVGIYKNGVLFEREILEPVIVELPGAAPALYYKYSAPEGGSQYVPHDHIEPTGQDWAWELWNSETEEFSDIETED